MPFQNRASCREPAKIEGKRANTKRDLKKVAHICARTLKAVNYVEKPLKWSWRASASILSLNSSTWLLFFCWRDAGIAQLSTVEWIYRTEVDPILYCSVPWWVVEDRRGISGTPSSIPRLATSYAGKTAYGRQTFTTQTMSRLTHKLGMI